MKFRDTAIKFKRFEVNSKARIVDELEHTIHAFEGLANDLDRQVKAEEDRTGVKDPAHVNYSTFARSARQRRDNLCASVAGLRAKLEAVQRERDDALEQLARVDASGVGFLSSADKSHALMPLSNREAIQKNVQRVLRPSDD